MVHVDGVRTFYRRVAGDGPPAVFVHGNPTALRGLGCRSSSACDGPAIALDLPGWGLSERPAGASTTRWRASRASSGASSTASGSTSYSLVVHDWGSRRADRSPAPPERVRRLVVINAVPLLPGYRWHWVARYLVARPGASASSRT